MCLDVDMPRLFLHSAIPFAVSLKPLFSEISTRFESRNNPIAFLSRLLGSDAPNLSRGLRLLQ
jgi:hypothetical protein